MSQAYRIVQRALSWILEGCLALFLFGLAACSGSSSAPGSLRIGRPAVFETRREIDVASRSVTSVLAADWTAGAGRDLLIASALDREIRLLVATQPGEFSLQAGFVQRFVEEPSELVRGDFDGDGDPDFACLFAKAQLLRIYWNDGRGRFQQLALPLRLPGLARAMAAYDLDRDGDDDLVLNVASRVVLFRSEGQSFKSLPALDVGRAAQLEGLALGDLDGDGFGDIAVTESTKSEAFVWFGSSAGFDAQHRLLLSLPGREALSLDIADVTGDRVADLVVALYGSRRLAVFPGDGRGNFSQASTIEVGGQPYHVTTARLAGSSQAQIIVSYRERAALGVVEARPGGAFGPERQFGTSGRPTRCQVLDLDEDGYADLLATSLDGSKLSYLRGSATGFHAAEDFATASPDSILSEDFDGDGLADLLVTDPSAGFCHVFAGRRADPRERLVPVARIAVAQRPTQLVKGDFDHDGRQDVVLVTEPGLRFLLNRSSAGLLRFVQWPSAGQAAIRVATTARYDVAVGRFDADAHDDVAVADSANHEISVLYSLADRLGFREERGRLSFPDGPTRIVAADLDGDGDTDLAALSSTGLKAAGAGSLRLFQADGLGAFTPAPEFLLGQALDSLQAADLNEDGSLELVASGRTRSEILIVEFRLGSFQSRSLPHALGNSALLIADVNADRHLDLVLANDARGDLSLVLGDGLGGFYQAMRIPAVFRPVSLASGDVDGDGRRDLLIASQFSDRVTLLRSLR